MVDEAGSIKRRGIKQWGLDRDHEKHLTQWMFLEELGEMMTDELDVGWQEMKHLQRGQRQLSRFEHQTVFGGRTDHHKEKR